MKLNDTFPLSYLPSNFPRAHIWYRTLDVNKEYPNTFEVMEFELTNFAYQFSVTVRFWADIKTSNNSSVVSFNNKNKNESYDQHYEIHKNKKNEAINIQSEGGGFSNATIKEVKNIIDESNGTVIYKEINESHPKEYRGNVPQVYDDENGESEYKLEIKTNLTEDHTSDVEEGIEMITQVQQGTVERATGSTEE